MKIVFLCNTVYQIIVATQLRHTIYKNEEADIVISDHMNGGCEIAERLKCYLSNFWKDIYYFESFDLARRRNVFVIKNKISNFIFLLFGRAKVNNMPLMKKKYDVFLFSNPDISTDFLYRNLADINGKIISYVFEDGFSTYSIAENDFRLYAKSRTYKMCPLFMQRTLFAKISGVYVFHPELMQWNMYEIIKIPAIDKSDKGVVQILNTTFQYEKMKDCYDKQVIFFEESYFKEGIDIGDIQIVDSIAQIVGKNNLMIKIHPRNGVNRFKEIGYKTNIDTAIPWEIIALNMNINDKILVTIASGAAIMPFLLFGSQSRSVILINMLNRNIEIPSQLSIYHDFIKSHVLNRYKKIFCAPSTQEDLYSLFRV